MGHGREFDSDVKEPMTKGDFYWPAMPEPDPEELRSEPYPGEEFLRDWLARTVEIIVKYRLKLLYFDWWIQHEAFKPYLKKLAAFYYNYGEKWGEDVLICYKHDAMMFGSGIVEVERGGFADSLDYKSSREIICTLLDVVSKNGNLLLNIGPKADGTLPDGDIAILKDLAAWMKRNGEAVTGAKVWRKSGEGLTKSAEGQVADAKEVPYTTEDYRFTANHGNIYAACLRCPKDGKFLVRSLAKSRDQNIPEFHGLIRDVKLLGYDGTLEWHVDEEGLHVQADGFCQDAEASSRQRASGERACEVGTETWTTDVMYDLPVVLRIVPE